MKRGSLSLEYITHSVFICIFASAKISHKNKMAPETNDIFNEFCILRIPASKTPFAFGSNNTQPLNEGGRNQSRVHQIIIIGTWRCGVYFQESHLFSI